MGIGKIILVGMVLITFNGCSTLFNLGENQTVCEENGCDYKDAGVCGNSFDIYNNWQKAKSEAYVGISCVNKSENTIIIKEKD